MSGSRSSTPTPSTPPRTPSRRTRPQSLIGNRMRSDSYSAILRSEPGTPARPGTPGTPGTPRTSRPASQYMETEQDMADLTAEMALLDDGIDSRSGRTIHSRGGGLRPLSLQYKPVARPQSSSSSDGYDGGKGSRLSRSISNPPRPTFYSTHTSSTSDFGGLSALSDPYNEKDVYTRAKNLTTFIKFLYRLRFILRILSLMGSGCVLGVLAHVTVVYLRTKDRIDPGTAEKVWPENLDLQPTNTLIAAAGLCVIVGLGWLIGSLNEGARKLDGGSRAWVRWAAAISAMITTGVWIAVIVHCSMMRHSNTVKTMFWVCSFVKTLKDGFAKPGEVDFRLHCGEIKTGWFAAIAVAAVDGLILLTIISGAGIRSWVNRRKGKAKASGWN